MDTINDEKLITALRLSMPPPLAGKPIAAEDHLKDDLGIDSLGLITLAFLLEDGFGVTMAGHIDALGQARTVKELSTLLQSLLSKQTSDPLSEPA